MEMGISAWSLMLAFACGLAVGLGKNQPLCSIFKDCSWSARYLRSTAFDCWLCCAPTAHADEIEGFHDYSFNTSRSHLNPPDDHGFIGYLENSNLSELSCGIGSPTYGL